jgi:outer membrane protein insertion porin family
MAQHVPEGKYLLKSNVVVVSGNKSVGAGIPLVIRQQPNFKSVGLKLKLFAWNRVTKLDNKIKRRAGKRTNLFYKHTIAELRIKKNAKIVKRNAKKRERADKKNDKKIKDAYERIEKNEAWNKANPTKKQKTQDKTYKHKYAREKDTLAPRKFFREWLRDKFGEKPVIYSDSLYQKSQSQIAIYMIKKGYYFSEITSEVKFNDKKRTAVCTYKVKTNAPFVIDSVILVSNEPWFKDRYAYYMRKDLIPEIKGLVLDQDMLDGHRSKIAKSFRDDAWYGFTPANITYQADTIPGTKRIKLQIIHSQRVFVQKTEAGKDTALIIPHREYLVSEVYFHILDSTQVYGSFKDYLKSHGFEILDEKKRLNTADSLFDKGPGRKGVYRRSIHVKYNRKSLFKPDILDFQSLLEHDWLFREKYIDRSYSNLVQLGVFSNIEMEFIENVEKATMEVHYYLTPAKRQGFSVEPKATSSNGFLGISIGANYVHKNLFGRAERLTIGFAGGLESQAVVIQATESESAIKKSGRSLNTFEIGPSLKLEFPWFKPIKIKNLQKRQKSRAIIQAGYNFQQRSEFSRGLANINLTWYFEVDKAQEFQLGVPFLSALRFVSLKKGESFAQLFNASNDQFLKNSYSDQFIYSDLTVKFTFQNMRKDKPDRKVKFPIFFKSNLDLVGNTLAALNFGQKPDANGVKKALGINYAQFVKIDLEYKAYLPVLRKSTLAVRAQTGYGKPYGNSKTSLPFDFGFFGGGSNDNRGFRSRALGPGVYKGYLDTNRVGIQLGDVQLGLNAELRFSISSMFKGAIFVDAGNIWTAKKDENRLGSQFTNDFYKQLAIATGVGLRLDLNFFIIRFDLGIPLRNPSYPLSSQWIWNSKAAYKAEIATFNANNTKQLTYVNPFGLLFNFGIGLPF